MRDNIVSMREHWNRIYASVPVQQLGWYEEVPHPSLRLLAECQLNHDDPILDVGAGASTFVDHLLAKGYRKVIAADISEAGLARLKERLGEERIAQVRWIVDDVTQPTILGKLQNVALWHDRALFHFLVEEFQRQVYLATLKRVLRPGGYVLLSTFSPKGAKWCSGLEVRNYDGDMLGEFLGEEFETVECFEYLYHMPSGEPRPYTCVCLQQSMV